ncbi:MAG: NUDIX hydrolase [Halobacteriales archaeon]
MEPEAVRRELHARTADVRATLADRWGTVPTRERTVPALDEAPPEHPDDLPPWAAVCLVTRGNEVLMLRNADHGTLEWEPPGGKGRPDERPADTARREVRETTGVTCDVRALLVVELLQFHYGGDEPYPVAQAVFAGPYIGGEAEAGEASIEAVGWFDARDLPENVQYRSLVGTHVSDGPGSRPI